MPIGRQSIEVGHAAVLAAGGIEVALRGVCGQPKNASQDQKGR